MQWQQDQHGANSSAAFENSIWYLFGFHTFLSIYPYALGSKITGFGKHFLDLLNSGLRCFMHTFVPVCILLFKKMFFKSMKRSDQNTLGCQGMVHGSWGPPQWPVYTWSPTLTFASSLAVVTRNVGWSEQPRSAMALALSMTISPEHASSLFYLATTYLYFLSFPDPTAGSNAPLLCHPPAPKDVKGKNHILFISEDTALGRGCGI